MTLRVVGLEGFEVTRVSEAGDQLDLEVEVVARAALCPRCGRATVEIKERPRGRWLSARSDRPGAVPPDDRFGHEAVAHIARPQMTGLDENQ